MAVTVLTPVKIPDVNTISAAVAQTAATSATDGFEFALTGKDYKTVIVALAGSSADATLTIKKGDSIQGVADVTLTVEKSTMAAFTLDSGSFKNVSGANKGKVKIIPSDTAVAVSVIELP